MDKLPPEINQTNLTEVSTDEIKDKDKDGITDKGQKVNVDAGVKHLPLSKSNQGEGKKISERSIVFKQSSDNAKQMEIDSSEEETNSSGYSSGYSSGDSSGDSSSIGSVGSDGEEEYSLKAVDKEFEELSMLADMWHERDELDWDEQDSSKLDLSEFTDTIFNSSASKASRISAARNFVEMYNNTTPCVIGMVLLQQMEQKNIPIENVSEEVFNKELNYLLEDMKSRGISFTSKVGKKQNPTLEKNAKLTWVLFLKTILI